MVVGGWGRPLGNIHPLTRGGGFESTLTMAAHQPLRGASESKVESSEHITELPKRLLLAASPVHQASPGDRRRGLASLWTRGLGRVHHLPAPWPSPSLGPTPRTLGSRNHGHCSIHPAWPPTWTGACLWGGPCCKSPEWSQHVQAPLCQALCAHPGRRPSTHHLAAHPLAGRRVAAGGGGCWGHHRGLG